MQLSTRHLPAPISLLVAFASLLATGCITREVVDPVYNRNRVEALLVDHRRGTQVIERDFSHPAKISVQRLAHIVGAIEIRGREEDLEGVRYVLEGSQIAPVAEALSVALTQATPNQTVAIRLTAKVMQHGIFDRKHLTSFVAYIRDDLLFVHVSRVDWKSPDHAKKTDPPLPRVDEHPMKFKVIPGKGMFGEGVYAVSVDWQSPLFSRPVRRASAEGKGQRTILLEDRSPLQEPIDVGIPSDVFSDLTAADLRELADLEEARQQGNLTEGHYRRQRQKILDAATKRSRRSN